MVTHHCDRCAHAIVVEEFQVGSVAQCPACGYVGTISGTGAEGLAAPPQARPAMDRRQPPPIPPSRRHEQETSDDAHRGPSRFLIALVAAGVVCSSIALVWGNPTTKLVVPLLTLAALNGYRVGGLKVIAAVVGLIVGTVLGVPLGRVCEGLVGRFSGLTGLTNRLVSVGLCAVLVAVLVAWAISFWPGRRLRRLRRFVVWDRRVGTLLGAAQGSVVALVLLWAVLVLEPVAAARVAMDRGGPDAGRRDPTAVRLVELAGTIRQSVIGRVADSVNPFSDVRAVTLPNKCLAMLNDPVALESFNRHPAIKRLRERPAVKRVVELLGEDPEIATILRSDEGLAPGDLATILGSPKLLEAIDQTDVMAELTPIADDIEQAVDKALDDAVAASQGP